MDVPAVRSHMLALQSVPASMPPLAARRYAEWPEPDSREAELAEFLRPRDWLD